MLHAASIARPGALANLPARVDSCAMGDVIAFILCLLLFLVGLFLFGLAATLGAWQGVVFFAGIVCVALSFGIPVHLLGHSERLER